MLKRLHIKNVGPADEMELELAPRLNLITGDNGLGKTFLLDIAWWAMTRRWPAEVNPKLVSGLIARPSSPGPASIKFEFTAKSRHVSYSSTFDRQAQAWTGRAGRPPNPGLVLYAQMDGSFAVWDPARNYWQKRGNVDVQERLPAYVFSPKEVWDGLPGTAGMLCNGLISDWAGWQKENAGPFKQLQAVLKALSPREGEQLAPGALTRISLDDVRDMPTLRMPYGKDVAMLHASAGMRRIVALAYLLVWSWQEHVRASKLLGAKTTGQIVFLIDEFEAHLHPRWQRSIVAGLLAVMTELAGKADVQVIAATHSPLLLASAEPLFDTARDAWFDLDLEREHKSTIVRLRRREFVRHGDVSNWLTSEAFDLKSARSMEAEQAIEQALALLRRKDAPTAAEVKRVDGVLRKAALPDIDPFWVRWSAFVERVGGRK